MLFVFFVLMNNLYVWDISNALPKGFSKVLNKTGDFTLCHKKGKKKLLKTINTEL